MCILLPPLSPTGPLLSVWSLRIVNHQPRPPEAAAAATAAAAAAAPRDNMPSGKCAADKDDSSFFGHVRLLQKEIINIKLHVNGYYVNYCN